METKNNIPPTNEEHNHEGAPCAECPEEAKESDAISIQLDLNSEIAKMKDDIAKNIKENLEGFKEEFKDSITKMVKDALKTKIVVGNLKAPKYETRKEEPNPFIDLMKSTI